MPARLALSERLARLAVSGEASSVAPVNFIRRAENKQAVPVVMNVRVYLYLDCRPNDSVFPSLALARVNQSGFYNRPETFLMQVQHPVFSSAFFLRRQRRLTKKYYYIQ
jgi:hypothetical protein